MNFFPFKYQPYLKVVSLVVFEYIIALYYRNVRISRSILVFKCQKQRNYGYKELIKSVIHK